MIDDMIKLLKEEQTHEENVQANCNENFRNNEDGQKESNTKVF